MNSIFITIANPGKIGWINTNGGGETQCYYHFDGLGSVVALSNSSANIVEEYSYDVFGEPNRTSDVNNPYFFTGRRYDDETGLYYYRARYYDYADGRFLGPDPGGYIDGLNLYTYVGNNPIIWVDPYGLAKITIWVRKAQPWGERTKTGGWGHAWIELKNDQGEIFSRGSYQGGLKDDSKTQYVPNRRYVSVTYDITEKQYLRTRTKIEGYGNNNWRKISENCTDFTYKAAEDWADVYLPGSDWGIDRPDKLAEDILENKEKIEHEGGKVKKTG